MPFSFFFVFFFVNLLLAIWLDMTITFIISLSKIVGKHTQHIFVATRTSLIWVVTSGDSQRFTKSQYPK